MMGARSSAGGAILGSSGNFRRWDLAGGSRSLREGPQAYLVSFSGPVFWMVISFIHMLQLL
jgi:hypothetical protein